MGSLEKKLRCLIGPDETKLQVIAMKPDLLPSSCPTVFGISIAQEIGQANLYTRT